MARSVCFALSIDPRVQNVCGASFACLRDLLLTSGRCGVFRGQSQLSAAQWSTADRVEVWFRGSKGDQLRKGAVVRVGPPRRVGAGGRAVDHTIGLLSCYLFLPPSAPLVAFGIGHGRWSLCT